MKKALLINSLYYPNVGGVENSISAINKCLTDCGWKVDIITSDNDQASRDPLPPETVTPEERIFRYHYKSRLGIFVQIFRAKNLIKKISQGLDYDLVIARSHSTVLSARLAGIKNINYLLPGIVAYQDKKNLHSKNYLKRVSYFVNVAFQRLALNVCSQSYVFSREMKGQVARFTSDKVLPKLINPGVDASRFKAPQDFDKSSLLEDLDFSEDSKLLLCVGRFTQVKGIVYAIKAMRHLDDKYKLVIVGEGPDEIEYRRYIVGSQLGSRVRLVPKTLSPERYYWLADFYVLPSLHEPFGQVLLEATASGLPVVAFPSSEAIETATSEIYQKHPSLVTFSEDVSEKSLADAVLSADTTSRQASVVFHKEKKDFLENYSWKKMLENIHGESLSNGW